MNRRAERLAAAIERGVREVLARGLHDPRVQGMITVTKVTVAPDLGRAVVDISVMPAEKQDLTFHAVSGAAAHIRREVGDLVESRELPEFVFRLDTSLKKQAQLLRALDRAKAELKPLPEPAAEGDVPPGDEPGAGPDADAGAATP